MWKDRNTDEVRQAQRDADYAFRLAVDPPAAKEVRIFGLPDWVLERFLTSRRHLHRLQYEATRMRERSVLASLAIVLAANGLVLWMLGSAALDHRLSLGALVAYASAVAGASMIAFGGLNWALDGAAAPVAAVARLKAAMSRAGTITERARRPADGMPQPEHRVPRRDLRLPGRPRPPRARRNFNLEIPAGSSLAIVGQNGAGKTTLAKLLCRLYDPQSGAIEADGTDLRDLDLESWRRRVTAVFQDFMRLRADSQGERRPAADRGRTLPEALDDAIRAALDEAGRDRPGRPGHAAGQGLRGRHRPVGRPVAARRPRPGAVLRPARRRPRAARRADGAARRARRDGDLRADPRRHQAVHDDPHLAPVLDRPARRPHLRSSRTAGSSSSAATTS